LPFIFITIKPHDLFFVISRHYTAKEATMFTFILALHIIVAIAMIGLILIQHGKGADAGASFGAGSSGTVFGAAGTANFLTRATAVLTAIFFITSMTLAVHARKQAEDQFRLDAPVSAPQTPRPLTQNPQ
jgi:preprotein translocase subunit SecG